MIALNWFGVLENKLVELSTDFATNVFDVCIGSMRIRCYVGDDVLHGLFKNSFFNVRKPEGEADCRLYCLTHTCRDNLPPFPWTKGECLGRLEMEGLPEGKHLIVNEEIEVIKAIDTQRMWGLLYIGDVAKFPSWELYAPFREFIHLFSLQRQCILVHAGSLCLDSQGVLLLGHGGAGKSTAVSQGVGQGYQSCGDDYVMVDTRIMRVYAVYRTFKLLPNAVFPVPKTHLAQQSLLDERTRKTVFYFDRKASHLVASFALKRIHILERDGHYRSEPLSGGPLLVKTMMSSVIQSPYEVAHYTRLFLFFVKQADLFKTALGNNLPLLKSSLREMLPMEEVLCLDD